MAELREQQIYEALGIEYDAGANGQAVADPAEKPDTPTEEGAKEQAVAEPAEVEKAAEPESGAAGESVEMDLQQRRENAARRRQQEQQAAVDRAVEAALQEERQRSAAALESIFTRAGLKNTITGEPIRTQADFDAWEQSFSRQKAESEMQSGKLTPETLGRLISEHPIVKQAQAMLAESQRQEQQRAEAAARQRVDAELQEIRAMEPGIQTLEDLFSGEKGKEIYDLTQKGLRLTDAYYLANRETREKAIIDGARQHAELLSRGKEHLKPNGSSNGSGALSVPAAELEMYRLFMPHASDAEIQAHYNKIKKH